MKLFIWSGNLDSGAYHGDGSAFVAAETLEQARQLVAEYDKKDAESNPYSSYSYSEAVSLKEPTYELVLSKKEKARVVGVEIGCDC